MSVKILLGTEARVTDLYSYKNSPTLDWTLAQTVQHWFGMTLDRDGLTGQGATASVTVGKSGVVLTLDGPAAIQSQLQVYSQRLPKFLLHGEQALTTVVPELQKAGKWDPSPDKPKPGQPPYHPWRFFLPHGMAMLNQKALLFFHYPPIRLLDTNQDYLNDPVPVRCEELLTANGVSAQDLPLFNTVLDATPIGAEDDQGSKKGKGIDKKWGVIPIQSFRDYQKAQVKLLLNPAPKHPGFTVPIVVYGAHPLATFNSLYGLKLKNNQVTVAEIRPGLKTPVMASTHPYVFYGTAQGFDSIGSGKLVNVKGATAQMIRDLVVAGWQKSMAVDPTQDPQKVLAACQAYWKAEAQQETVAGLVQHQGSLKYSDPTTLKFEYLVPLPKSAKPVVASSKATPAKAAVSKAAPAKATPAKASLAAVRPAASQAASRTTSLTAYGDSGKPVDWWFIYKVSKTAQSSAPGPVTGAEYAYYDSEMNRLGQPMVLSPNRIDAPSGALFQTLSPLFTPTSKSSSTLGWFAYNDESQLVTKKDKKTGKPEIDPATGQPKLFGTGPLDRGHCKGVLAFDLNPQNDSAFWLVHSVPLFPLKLELDYPKSGFEEAQTFLCITLKNSDTSKSIAQLMYDAHGPNVNVHSSIPSGLDPKDPRSLLMQDKNGSTGNKTAYPPGNNAFLKAPFPGQVNFFSRGSQQFTAIAKNKFWGKDFYNDLVGPILNQDLEVETWEMAGNRVPPAVEPGETHKVESMKSVNLGPSIPYSWSEEHDHAKLAISDRTNPKGSDLWVCVGDINFTDTMEKRGGGTVAFKCPLLCQTLARALSDEPLSPSLGKKSASPKVASKAAKTTATGKTSGAASKSAKKAVAKKGIGKKKSR